MAEYKYVELPEKGHTHPGERQAAVNEALAPLTAEGWEPISIAEAGKVGTIAVMLRRD